MSLRKKNRNKIVLKKSIILHKLCKYSPMNYRKNLSLGRSKHTLGKCFYIICPMNAYSWEVLSSIQCLASSVRYSTPLYLFKMGDPILGNQCPKCTLTFHKQWKQMPSICVHNLGSIYAESVCQQLEVFF